MSRGGGRPAKKVQPPGKRVQPVNRDQHERRRAAAATDGREVVYAEQSYTGPLPEPADLRAYDMVVPGSAKTIVDAFEDQTRHRRELERAVVTGSEGRSSRGQWMAYSAMMTGVIGGCVVAVVGDPVSGAAIAGAAFASSAVTYALGGRPPKPE